MDKCENKALADRIRNFLFAQPHLVQGYTCKKVYIGEVMKW